MAPCITRHFASLPGRTVHYRRCGSGPVLVMIHQSPQDSSEFETLMTALAAHFTVFAPDTPGYGLSDPVVAPDTTPPLDRFVDALLEWLAFMGIEKAAFYGLHSGASAITRLAARRPDRVARLVTNGLALCTPEERRDLLARYLPRFEPTWDGGHLTWLWERLRDQGFFFPWYAGHHGATPGFPGDTLADRTRYLQTFLRAGDNYRTAYRAVFEIPLEHDLAAISCPVLALLAAGDPLSEQFHRFAMPEGLVARPVAGLAEIVDAVVAFCGDLPVQVVPEPAAPAAGRRMVATGQGTFHVDLGGRTREAPVLLLHERGGHGRMLDRLARSLRDDRPVVVPDLPLHGASHGFDPQIDLAGQARALDALLDALGLETVDLATIGSAAAAGAALAAGSARVRRHVAINPLLSETEQASAHPVPLAIDEDGAQLHAAWRVARGLGFAPEAFLPGRALHETGVVPVLADVQLLTVAILDHMRFAGRPLASFACDPSAFRAPDVLLRSAGGACGPVNAPELPDSVVHWSKIVSQALKSS